MTSPSKLRDVCRVKLPICADALHPNSSGASMSYHLVLLLWLLLAGLAACIPTAEEFLRANCSAYELHEGLVLETLRPYMAGLSLLDMKKGGRNAAAHEILPIVQLSGSAVLLDESFKNPPWLVATQYIPLFEDAAQNFQLPQTYMLLWGGDVPPTLLETSGMRAPAEPAAPPAAEAWLGCRERVWRVL